MHIYLGVTQGSYHWIIGLISILEKYFQLVNLCHSEIWHYFCFNYICSLFNHPLGKILIAPHRYICVYSRLIGWHSIFPWLLFIGDNCRTSCHATPVSSFKKLLLNHKGHGISNVYIFFLSCITHDVDFSYLCHSIMQFLSCPWIERIRFLVGWQSHIWRIKFLFSDEMFYRLACDLLTNPFLCFLLEKSFPCTQPLAGQTPLIL